MTRIARIAVLLLATAAMMFAQAAGSAQSSTSTTGSMPQAPASSGAPSSNAASTSASQSAIAPGTPINAELSKSIDSKKAKEGDQVQAKVVQDTIAAGKILVPRNSRLFGHLTQVKAGGKGEASSLGIAFDKVVLKGGQEIPLHGVIQALAPAPRMPSQAPMGGADMSDAGSGGMSAPAGAGGYGASGGSGGAMNRPMESPPPAASGGVSGVGPATTNNPNGTVGNSGNNNAGGTNAPGMTGGGQLTAASRGVMGLPGVTIEGGADNSGATVITNQKKNVKLDSGTQMVLRVTAQ